MIKAVYALLGTAAVVALCACSQISGSSADLNRTVIGEGVPRSPQQFFDQNASFQFAVVGDRTGGHRPGVFEAAMDKVNLLRPEFVISVGDLVEGYTDDPDKIDAEWDEVEAFIGKLDMTFFYVAGNHDLSNPMMVEAWRKRRGDPYYSFVYKNVLFIALDTEDPPIVFAPEMLERTQSMEAAMAKDPEGTQARILKSASKRSAPVKLPGSVDISDAQLTFVKETLASHQDVRWTMIFLHKPAWMYDSAAFAQIEKMLQDRPYTVIAGHEHYYAYDSRFDRDYIDMGTTGGVWVKDGPGRLDHVAWVTMTQDGPVFANIAVNGISDKLGPD